MRRAAWVLFLAAFSPLVGSAAEIPGFRESPWFEEQVREQWLDNNVRVVVNVPGNFDAKKPTRLVIFATPNGNSIEQTLGQAGSDAFDKMSAARDPWRFQIQHIAAQIRKLREISPDTNIVVACAEAEGLSWPAWKRKISGGPKQILKVVDTLRSWIPSHDVKISLAAHSGGGSFLWGYIDAYADIPKEVDHIVFLDANYSYSDADKHGDKLLAWLKSDRARRLVVIAYDDRKITLNGKLVVEPDGGTYRATERMVARLAKDVMFAESTADDFVNRIGMDGQVALHVHKNPKNLILHTALVGDMNGLLRGLTDLEAKPTWGSFGGPPAYTKWVQAAAVLPPRPKDALGGAAFFRKIEKLSLAEREEAIAIELGRGNMPDFLRTFQKISIKAKDTAGKERNVVFEVMPDYLAIGSDSDFVRVPMTPMTAARVADLFYCALPTRKIVDEVYKSATVKLEPRPLTKDREAAATFLEHNSIIETQRAGQKLGALVAGIKKDIVVSNRLGERPNRLALYGWHKTDGAPIQPLTIVHWNRYVDYSHGARLLKRTVFVDGVARDIRHLLHSPDFAPLLSDEGPILYSTY